MSFLRPQTLKLSADKSKNHLWTFVRWYRWRKPLWMGRAKSKMYFVSPTPVIPEADAEELKKLVNNYKTEFKSIQEYCYKEYYLKASATSEAAVKKQEEDQEELSRLLHENEQENQRIAVIREKYVEAEAQMRDQKLQGNVLKYMKLREQQKEKAKKDIEKLEMLVKSEITPDTLDDAIEKALETEVDYNFAISLDGKIDNQKRNETSINS